MSLPKPTKYLRLQAITLARELRKNQTYSESVFWETVRNRNFKNLKFTRQKPIFYGKSDLKDHFFIVDFYCSQHKLIIEIDGDYHQLYEPLDKDREEILKTYGFNILRFTNEEVNSKLEIVLEQIENYCS